MPAIAAPDCPLPTADCSPLTAHRSLLTAHCSAAHSSLLTACGRCSLLTAHCSLLAVAAHSSSLTAHCSLLTDHSLHLLVFLSRFLGRWSHAALKFLTDKLDKLVDLLLRQFVFKGRHAIATCKNLFPKIGIRVSQRVPFAKARNSQTRAVFKFHRPAFAIDSVARLALFREHAARGGKWIRRGRGGGVVCGRPRRTRRGRCFVAATQDEECNEGYQKRRYAKLHFQTPAVISWNGE